MIQDLTQFTKSELFKQNSKFSDFDEDCKDIVAYMLYELTSSFDIGEIWKETIEINEENNKRILGYIYSILRTAKNQLLKNTEYKVETDLYRVVDYEMKELVGSNSLSVTKINHKEFYYLPNKINPSYFNKEVNNYNVPLINVWRGKEQLDHKSIKEGIIKIISFLENYKFSVSDLYKVIIDNSNINIPVKYSSGNKEGGSSDEGNIFVDKGKKFDDIDEENQKSAERLLMNFRNLYPKTMNGEKKFIENIKILYWTYNSEPKLNQEQIALRVFNSRKRFRSISTRQRTIEKNLNELKNKKEVSFDENELKAFLLLIKKRFITKEKFCPAEIKVVRK